MSEDFDAEAEAEVIETIKVKTGMDVLGIYRQAFVEGAGVLIPVAVAAALWLVTVWVPFINIGTTIAMLTLPVWMAAGRKPSPIDIFQGAHRSRMFGLLRLHGLVVASTFILLLIMVAAMGNLYALHALPRIFNLPRDFGPGFWSWIKTLLFFAGAAVPFFMLTTAWAMAPFLMIDRDLDPAEAIQTSYDRTAGKRLGIFAIYAPPLVVGLFLACLFGRIPYVGWLLAAVVVVATATATVALSARVYTALCITEA